MPIAPPVHAVAAPARVPALDGLRGVAVLLVLASHVASGWRVDGVGHWLLAPFASGWLGVDLFFALSGYLITAQLVATRGAADYFRAFYLRRLRRIWPLQLLLLATLAAVAWGIAPDTAWGAQARPQLPWLVAHLANVPIALEQSFAALPAGTSHLWSLAVEEQFYAVWPLVVAVVAPRRLLGVALCGALASVAARLAMGLAGHATEAFVLPVTRADGLMLGAAVAAAGRHVTIPVRGVGLAALGVYLAVAMLEGATWQLHPGVQGIGLLACSAAAAGLVAWARTGPSSPLDAAWLRWCGQRSYGLYVWHFPVMQAMDTLAEPAPGAAGLPAVAQRLAAVLVTFPLAEASWRCWERRWLTPRRQADASPREAPAIAA
ncbi:acyltransferase [Roseisolibacter sp. H3M3-2]|uniref:acyltransferase family protein n=1 Tax=Roseisolibacter sp. H3M3-2 TaxID=3031323 RepID=UPI0023DAF8D9|nr:acyltransferase [Roseisolibacter sp. H3M3-2]MDF1505213.1 acyltransferase [Roseisolibacter sp. H3M3-2]